MRAKAEPTPSALHYTEHARARLQQRGARTSARAILEQHGEVIALQSGGRALIGLRAATERDLIASGMCPQTVAAAATKYLVTASDGCVITCLHEGHRRRKSRKRPRRALRRSQRFPRRHHSKR